MIKLILFTAFTISFSAAQVARADVADSSFSIVDFSGSIVGQPNISRELARGSWDSACRDWKRETKEINSGNQILAIDCNTPVCSILDSGQTECSSSGHYQIKTAGVRAETPQPVAVAPAPVTQTVVQPVERVVTVEPQVIYEETPPPRIGFVWVPGFWGWHGHYHYWHRGYWHHPHRHW